jgi:hypothetical protein
MVNEQECYMITLETAINAVLDFAMDMVKENNFFVESIGEYVDSYNIPVIVDLSDKDYNKMYNFSGAKWEKLFKERFGYTDHQFIEQHQKLFRASLTENERSLLTEIENVCGCSMWFEASKGGIGGTYWQKTPTKLAYLPDNSWSGGIQFHDGWIGEHGFTLAEVEAFLIRIGVQKRKRPRQKRIHNYSLYD